MTELFHRCITALLMTIAVLLSPLVVANSDDSSSSDTERKILFEALANAENEQQGRNAEGDIWRFWFDQSPTEEVRTALDAGMERREAYDFEAAENILDTVVESAPAYAEGYNQRAFVRFLREKYDDSQEDLEKALELEPDHFGAMSGLFHILRRQNRQKAALSLLQKAVGIHPWLKERSALPESLWPKSYRDIHEPGQEI